MQDTDHDRLEEDAPRVKLVNVLLSMVAFWACYYVLATARSYLIGFEFQQELMALRLVVIVASLAVTVLLWLLLRGFDHHNLWVRFGVAFVAALPASLLLAVINTEVFREIEERAIYRLNQEQGVTVRRDQTGNILVDVPQMPTNLDDLDPELPREVKKAMERAGREGGREGEPIVIDRDMQRDMMWVQLTDIALGRYFLLLAWAALYFAMTQAEHARAAERREGEYKRAAKAAELKSLRYQVNPHFLFNTLNSLSALVMVGRNEQAEAMIQTISTFYRRSLTGDPVGDVPLAEEIELQRTYLQIESVRFPDRLRIVIEVPKELESARVPGMILQPLIENSVKYAVAPVSRTVTIFIAAVEEYGRLVLTVADNGPGSPAKDKRVAADSSGNAGSPGDGRNGFGIGLANVRSRLETRFGKDVSVVSGDTGNGWRTVIRMPLERNTRGE
ncbi:sensor histidine kinase [Croceicoccus marinus]|uniref:histidine kinase n=1 Tax=Croceicoccus marinus TaxID=450378 RepID=A0A1Z1FFN8_9SPHN|nr:histidine kinase [Croceicoccus marinus]ARU17546.1 sensor histidine kinase [Croceicoccus marinus]